MFKRKRSAGKSFAGRRSRRILSWKPMKLKREGLSDEEARWKARIEFGNLRTAQERSLF